MQLGIAHIIRKTKMSMTTYGALNRGGKSELEYPPSKSRWNNLSKSNNPTQSAEHK